MMSFGSENFGLLQNGYTFGYDRIRSVVVRLFGGASMVIHSVRESGGPRFGGSFRA